MLVVGLLQSLLHRLKQRRVPSILGLERHLGDIDRLLFNQVLLVDKAQAPGLDELVGKLPMEEEAALPDAPSYPRLEGRLSGEKVNVQLL